MRNVVTSADAGAQRAGSAVIADGGGAADAVIAGMLAGAARASPASLLGSGVVLVAGAGAGASFVDGRARVPGMAARRARFAGDPPRVARAAVPGLLAGALAAHNRFGRSALGNILRTVASAVMEQSPDAGTLARLEVLHAIARTGLHVLDRRAMMEVGGLAAGGPLTRSDLAHHAPSIRALRVSRAGDYEVLRAPRDRSAKDAPPVGDSPPIGAVLAADGAGVLAVALWAVAEEAVALPDDSGLSLAALSAATRKGVASVRPGTVIPLVVPAAILRSDGRAWAAVAIAGTGALLSLLDHALAERLGAHGFVRDSRNRATDAARGVVAWVVRDANDEVRASETSHG